MRGNTDKRLKTQGATIAQLEKVTDTLGRRAVRLEARIHWLVSRMSPAEKARFELFERALNSSELLCEAKP